MNPKDKVAFINEMQDKLNNLRFLIRKRLSLNPLAASESEVEEALVLFQAIDDVMQEKHPVTVDEAVSLGAIRLQVELGDQNFRKMPSYDGVVDKHIPKYLMQKDNRKQLTQMLENTHGALKGLNASDANKKYLEIIRSWPYHGSSHFMVKQNYTNDMPENLKLSINYVGVHVFENLQKVL
jgi:hypothetical protein